VSPRGDRTTSGAQPRALNQASSGKLTAEIPSELIAKATNLKYCSMRRWLYCIGKLAILPHGSNSEFVRPDHDSTVIHAADGGWPSLDSGCLDQYQNVSRSGPWSPTCFRIRRGPAVRHAEPLHRARRRDPFGTALDADSLVPPGHEEWRDTPSR
jgi:hypothetical protein